MASLIVMLKTCAASFGAREMGLALTLDVAVMCVCGGGAPYNTRAKQAGSSPVTTPVREAGSRFALRHWALPAQTDNSSGNNGSCAKNRQM